MKPKISEADFAVLAKQTGLPLNAETMATLYGVFWMVEDMIERVTRPMPVEIEPAHMFTPEVR